jgi:phosphoglucosamine mutase
VVKKLGRPVSEICHRFTPVPQVQKNVRYKTGRPLENGSVAAAIQAAERRLAKQGRLVVRPSGTEPVIRVMGEGDDRDLVEAVVDDIVEALTKAAA